MDKTGFNRKRIMLAFSMFLSSIVVCCSFQRTERIVIENENFRYVVDSTGKNLHFIDKKSGIDYLNDDTVSYCSSIKKDEKEYSVNRVTLEGEILKLNFDEADVTAALQVITADNHIRFKVKEVTGEPWSMTFINIPLNLDGMSYEPFGACILQ